MPTEPPNVGSSRLPNPWTSRGSPMNCKKFAKTSEINLRDTHHSKNPQIMALINRLKGEDGGQVVEERTPFSRFRWAWWPIYKIYRNRSEEENFGRWSRISKSKATGGKRIRKNLNSLHLEKKRVKHSQQWSDLDHNQCLNELKLETQTNF